MKTFVTKYTGSYVGDERLYKHLREFPTAKLGSLLYKKDGTVDFVTVINFSDDEEYVVFTLRYGNRHR